MRDNQESGSAEQAVDILLYVALAEELDTVIAFLGDGFTAQELKDVALTWFSGSIQASETGKRYSVAVVAAGKMGNTRSANIASVAIEKLKPSDIVVIGIAGSLSNDLEPGDVFVPDSVNEYLANSASVGEKKTWSLDTSGNHFQSSQRLLDRLQKFRHTRRKQFEAWRDQTRQRRSETIAKSIDDALVGAGVQLRGECSLLVGDDRKLASGPVVGKGKAFLTWLKKQVDRKIAAMEMESAGIFDAGSIRTPAPRVVAIRGISDFADERKDKIEKIAENAFRALSMENALSLFVASVEAGLFEPDVGRQLESAKQTQLAVLQSAVKSVLVIGGVTGETDDTDAETPRLHRAAMKLGKTLAEAGAHLVVCSPFPDSADYYAAMGYADTKVRGVIHFHSPSHPKVEEKKGLLKKMLGHADLIVQEWNYPGPEVDDGSSWSQAWLLAQLQALEKVDAVVALGGKVSKTANTLLHLAEAKSLPIIPFSFLGGAAQRANQRRDWARLNPDIDVSFFAEDIGIEQTIRIANMMQARRVSRAFSAKGTPQTIFISRASQDAGVAQDFANALRLRGIEALIGDDEVRPDQMVPASIENAMLRSNICAVLWSKQYALSPWCFDELSMALSQHAYGNIGLWLFNLDDSLIVPIQARKMPTISLRDRELLSSIVDQLLAEPQLK
ncbi:MAG: TIR domain-containing protein [Alphaproteobacteria bacterium]|jgi:nucleoside phosphorylase|nr:TIR domain-containing protein [Alphaproteobacteria bacterium]MBU1549665.1 TIR domain-containing protein [Alphaproteobacteria bacterium]MBU2336520.1 TIR domain-containing protein [Alphaproteobacteria bacterium]MBU2387599.1 TIR domain-containing protein [Alphaproteobacteria bacterium]